MSNETSEIGLVHLVVNVTNEKDLNESLMACIDMDNDLTENEDYFQDDTLELGFESEAHRIVSEAVKEHGLPTDYDTLLVLLEQVTGAITDQEYFGECNLSILATGRDNEFSIAFAYGGE